MQYSAFRSSWSSSGAETGKCLKYAFTYGFVIRCRTGRIGASSTVMSVLVMSPKVFIQSLITFVMSINAGGIEYHRRISVDAG